MSIETQSTPDELLDRVERVLEGVTPEPWVAVVKSYSRGLYEAAHIPCVVEEGMCGDEVDGPLSVEDARFIAECRTLVPALAEALRAARARVAELERDKAG